MKSCDQDFLPTVRGRDDANLAVVTEAEHEGDAVKRCLQTWFPADTFIRVARIGDYPILPEERALVAHAVDRRRHEFATGRWLSREGTRSFGLPDRPIMIGRLRNPVWPDLVAGTISHDGGLCAVALRRKNADSVVDIGIDLVGLPVCAGRIDELASMFVASAHEIDSVMGLGVAVDPTLLLFSLKESVIKAMSRRLGDFIDMREVDIRHANGFEIHTADMVVAADLFGAVVGSYLVTAANIR